MPEVEIRLLNIDVYRSTNWWLPLPGAAIAFIAWYRTNLAAENPVGDNLDTSLSWQRLYASEASA